MMTNKVNKQKKGERNDKSLHVLTYSTFLYEVEPKKGGDQFIPFSEKETVFT